MPFFEKIFTSIKQKVRGLFSRKQRFSNDEKSEEETFQPVYQNKEVRNYRFQDYSFNDEKENKLERTRESGLVFGMKVRPFSPTENTSTQTYLKNSIRLHSELSNLHD
tara:strand:+ start:123 stop:446 length:324 start_codon:yes stop_codon:yes gene_type:complete